MVERFTSRAAAATEPDDKAAVGPAVLDARAILARAAADAAAADEARQQFLTEPLPSLEPDARIGPLLAPDERVLAVRQNAAIERRQATRDPDAPLGVAGGLYVTSLRVMLVGRVVLSFRLREIEEIGVAAERLILILAAGTSVSVQTAQPRLLRVQIATARAEARG